MVLNYTYRLSETLNTPHLATDIKTEIDATSVQALTGLYVQFRHAVLLVRKGFKDTVRMKSESGIYIRGAFVGRHPVCYVKSIPTIFRTSHGVATG